MQDWLAGALFGKLMQIPEPQEIIDNTIVMFQSPVSDLIWVRSDLEKPVMYDSFESALADITVNPYTHELKLLYEFEGVKILGVIRKCKYSI